MDALDVVWLGLTGYSEAWAEQRRSAEARRRGESRDTLLLVEHPAVYTVGRNGDPHHLGEGPQALRDLGAEYHDVDRGGSVTFHGPGQLVAYPIVGLAERFPVAGHPAVGDVIEYLRCLEECLIATVAQWDITAVRRPPFTGIWIPGPWRKLAAIGVKLARGVTTHGIALNLTTDLTWFSHVTPCGIEDAGVCSVASITGRQVGVREAGEVFAAHLDAALAARATAAVVTPGA